MMRVVVGWGVGVWVGWGVGVWGGVRVGWSVWCSRCVCVGGEMWGMDKHAVVGRLRNVCKDLFFFPSA